MSDKTHEAEIIEVSREVDTHEFISNLPEGYDTTVGEKWCQLSGDKSRETIPRNLIKRGAIMLLDEDTRALDAESDRFMARVLEKTLKRRTTQVTLVHRFHRVLNSDIIAVMDRTVVEIGSHKHQ